MRRREHLQRHLDGGGLLQLVSLLAVHVGVAALVGIAASPALGLALLLIPIPTSAAVFELAYRRVREQPIPSSTVIASGGILATCWGLGLVQCALTIAS